MERIELNPSKTINGICWSNIDWKEVELYVERLQGRIYKATDKKDFKLVINLQKLTIRSYFVKIYAIRQVTMINRGKYTPGIDGRVCKNNEEREELYRKIQHFSMKSYRPKPVRRVEIPKLNGKTRPIGIPTIFDRVIQTIVKIALEPEWECKFHKNSFGFRPGRSTQDAIKIIEDNIKTRKGDFILDADLTGCFDNIAHAPLLSKLHIFKPIIYKWLKAGVLIDNKLIKATKGTPQGGIISPLLANIALNDLDYNFNRLIEYHGRYYPLTLVRYADDMVILTSNKVILSKVKIILANRLKKQGLSLNQEKTKLVHKSEGFTFLGFHIIQHLGHALWTQVDKSSVKRVLQKIKYMMDTNKQVKIDGLIYALNKIIHGWARYYQYCRIHKDFYKMDAIVFRWTWKWCTRRHPMKRNWWIKEKYFTTVRNRSWTLYGKIWTLHRFSDIKRKSYKWIVGNKCYFNPVHRKLWKLQILDN